MLNVGTAVGYLMLDTSGYTSALKQAGNDLKIFQDSTATVNDKLKATSSAFNTVGMNLTKGVTLPLVGLGAVATKTAAEFEEKMSKVEAISGATAEQMQDLTNKALEMGAKTKYSAAESADAFTYMAMAGWDAEQMIAGIEGIMNLAAADGIELARASDIVTDALTAFGLEAGDAAHFANVLAVAASESNTNVDMLGESFKYVGAVAGSMNMSIEDVSLALGVMANAGVKSSQAGTTLRSVLTRLSTNAGATSNSLGALDILTEKLGVQFYDTAGNVRDLSDVLDETREAWKGLSDEEAANYAKKIAGQTAIAGFLSLMNAETQEYEDLKVALNNSEDAAEKMAETMMDNLAGSIEQLGGAVETLLIQIGTLMIPTIQSTTDTITLLVEKLSQVDESTVETAIKIASMVAAFGPILLIVSKVISAFSMMINIVRAVSLPFIHLKEALSLAQAGMTALASNTSFLFTGLTGIKTALSALISPVGLTVAAIAALVAGFVLLYQNSEGFREAVNNIVASIGEKLQPVFEDLKETFESVKGSLSDTWTSIEETFVSLQPTFELFGELVGDVIALIAENLSDIATRFGALLIALQPVIELIIDLFANRLVQAVHVVSSIIEIVMENFANFADVIAKVFQVASDAVNAITALFQGDMESFKEYVNDFITHILELIGQLGTFLWDLVGSIVSNLWEALVQFFNNTLQSFLEFIQKIPQKIDELWAFIKEWLADLPYKVGYFLGFVITKAIQFFKDIVKNAKDWLTDMEQKRDEVKQQFFDKLLEFLKELPKNFKEWLDNAIQKIADAVPNIKTKGKDVMNSFWEGLKEIWDSIVEWFQGVMESVASFLSGINQGVADANAATSSLSSNGSHANGLLYVPFDGYRATLHEGERVLTRNEAEEYNNGNTGGGNTFIFNSPERIDEYEAQRLIEETIYDIEHS